MPDDNKFGKLRAIGYSIPGLCGYCKHSKWAPAQSWGTCNLHTYQHLKHDNPNEGRGISIHITGTCPQFERAPNRIVLSGLGAHQEFFQGEARGKG